MSDLDRLRTHVKRTLGPPARWPEHPGGWRNEIEAALIDAILSANARYGGAHSGVRGAVARWRESQGDRQLDDLEALQLWVGTQGSEAFTDVLGNRQFVPGRGSRPRKAEAIIATAEGLRTAGVLHASDVERDKHMTTFTGTRGVGPITWHYFLMLLNIPGIKADRMIVRFVASALRRSPREIAPKEAETLLLDVAGQLGVSPTELDYAAWTYQRRR